MIKRYISIFIFSSIVLTILMYPLLFKNLVHTSKHSFIVFLIMVACLAIIHGIGFTPDKKFWRIITNPLFTSVSYFILLYFLFFS